MVLVSAAVMVTVAVVGDAVGEIDAVCNVVSDVDNAVTDDMAEPVWVPVAVGVRVLDCVRVAVVGIAVDVAVGDAEIVEAGVGNAVHVRVALALGVREPTNVDD